MDALPVLNVVTPPTAAAAVGAATAEDIAANDAAATTDTAVPGVFRALLALQLGSAGPAIAGLASTAEAPPVLDAASDDKPTVGTPTLLTTDALAGLTLPALLPVATQAAAAGVAATQTQVAATGASNIDAPDSAAASATDPRALPRAATDSQAANPHAAATVRAEAVQRAGDGASVPAVKVPAGGETARAIDAPPALAAQPQPAQSATASAPAAAPAALEARVGTPGWNTELGQKIVWMIGDKHQVAELRVNPPELGPLDIKLTFDGQKTSALFTSPHSAVREAVEAALPRLREVLADSGIELGNASVTADSPRDDQAFAQPRPGAHTLNAVAADATAAAAADPARVIERSRGLVDLFA